MTKPIRAQAESDPRLGIVRDLVTKLEEGGVAYCHWKSNESLREAVSGRTDLDILFDPEKRMQATAALGAAGFVEYETVGHKSYPGIRDFVGIDPDTGRIVHVHAHFLLVVGETGLRSYHLKLEPQVLRDRQWDEADLIFRSDAANEMLLLLVREAMKLNPDQLKRLQRPDRKPSGAEREFAWLKARVRKEELPPLAAPLLGSEGMAAIEALYAAGMTGEGLERLKGVVETRLRGSRRYSPFGVRLALLMRRIIASAVRRARSFGMRGLRHRRTLAHGGLIVAFVGPDGAGKSTVSAAVTKELSRKVEVEQVYMGSGRGSAGITRSVLERLRLRKLGGPFRTLWRMALAAEKRHRLRKIERWRRKGKIVVSDRYPQVDVEGYNDGPLLAHLRESRFVLLRRIAGWERRCYSEALVVAPDIAFRMTIDLDGLARRRPGMSVETIRKKQQGIAKIRFPAQTRVIDLNSDQPLELVVRDAMAEIGRVLRERGRRAEKPRRLAAIPA
jgi:hypothetical protein